MTIPDHRLSDAFIDAPYIPPEDATRYSFLHDMEGGPLAVGNTAEGMNYQPWSLTYDEPDIILTPSIAGNPVTVLTVPDVKQASFCFDQNARPAIVYGTTDSRFHYWYDSYLATFVTTEYANAMGIMLSLDDKRERQLTINDMILWYTEQVGPSTYHLYTREQRDRFTIPYLMESNGSPVEVPPYIWKAGMHQGLRGKITFTYVTP